MTYKVLESICHEQAKIGPATTAEKRSTVKVAATNVAQCQTFDYKGHTFECLSDQIGFSQIEIGFWEEHLPFFLRFFLGG